MKRIFPRSIRGTLILLLLIAFVPFLARQAFHYYNLVQDQSGQSVKANLQPPGLTAAVQPSAEPTPIYDALKSEIAEDVAVVILAFIIVTIAGRAITRPIRLLQEHAIALGRGELGHRVDVNGLAELADLASAFNSTAEQLQMHESEQARAAASRLFLAETTSILANSLDLNATLQKVARLAVPYLADWCAVDLIGNGNVYRASAVAHVDPFKEELAHEVQSRYPLDLTTMPALAEMMHTGRTLLIREISESDLVAFACDADHLRMIRELGPKSYMLVPLKARGRMLGVVALAITASSRRYDQDDVVIAEALVHRAALAIDNARLYDEAQEAINLRDEFLAVAAHELKTPITSLRGYAQLLVRQFDKEGTMDPMQLRQGLTVIDQQARKLTRLILQLFDVSDIQAGQLAIDREIADLSRLVVDVVEAARATTGRHTFTVRAPTSLMASVDPVRLRQVVIALIDNVIRYSPHGGQIEVAVSQPAAETVRLAVVEPGDELPPGRQQRVVDRLIQADAPGYSAGVDLELFIAQHIVRLHGGTIAVEFPPATRIRFVLDMPVELEMAARSVLPLRES